LLELKKTLLLNSSYEVLTFVSEKRAIKLLIKDKCEIISSWDDIICWGSGQLQLPSILRLKTYVKVNYFASNFSRKAVVKRDKSFCQYCGQKLSAAAITIDHVIPRAQKGATSFTNCVVSCHTCNNKKANRTPEQAGLILLKRPIYPPFGPHYYLIDPKDYWHAEWDGFLANYR
jgi:5-methylcytosine-specific restriction endonuclease McrA